MDPKLVEAILRKNLTDGQPHWELPQPDLLQIWWREAYAEVIERPGDLLLRFNFCDRPAPGVAATRFHWNRREQQRHGIDGAIHTACNLLKIYEGKRNTYSYCEDPVFGLLVAEHHFRDSTSWSGTLHIDLFDQREASIDLMCTKEGPTDVLRAWFVEFLNRQTALRAELDKKILEHYREYDEAAGCNLDLNTVADLPQFLNPLSIALQHRSEYDKDQFQVKANFFWDAAWNDEHGVDALLHDFRIIEVGML